MQSNTTNQVKLYLDWTPMANVGLSFEGNWAKSTTTTSRYGRTRTTGRATS